jgi:hypothetical protein
VTTLKHLLPLALLVAALAGGAYYWYFHIHKPDGVACERDVHCPGRLCLRDFRGSYCSRPCESDEPCREGWRCLAPPNRNLTTRGCVRPRTGP